MNFQFNIILPSTQRFPKWSLTSDFLTKILYALLLTTIILPREPYKSHIVLAHLAYVISSILSSYRTEIIQNLPQKVLWGEHQEKGICAWTRMPPNLSHLYVRAANEEPLVQDTTPATGGNVTFVAGSSDENWQNEKVNKVDVAAHHLTGYWTRLLHTNFHFQFNAQYLLFTATTSFGQRTSPFSGSYKLQGRIQHILQAVIRKW